MLEADGAALCGRVRSHVWVCVTVCTTKDGSRWELKMRREGVQVRGAIEAFRFPLLSCTRYPHGPLSDQLIAVTWL